MSFTGSGFESLRGTSAQTSLEFPLVFYKGYFLSFSCACESSTVAWLNLRVKYASFFVVCSQRTHFLIPRKMKVTKDCEGVLSLRRVGNFLMKGAGILVILFRCVNCRFWYLLGYSGKNANILTHTCIAYLGCSWKKKGDRTEQKAFKDNVSIGIKLPF